MCYLILFRCKTFFKFFNGYHGHAQHHRPSHLIKLTISKYKRGEQNLEETKEQNKRIVSSMNFTESSYKCHTYSWVGLTKTSSVYVKNLNIEKWMHEYEPKVVLDVYAKVDHVIIHIKGMNTNNTLYVMNSWVHGHKK